MTLLTLLRHGRAAPPSERLADHARPLVASGRRDVLDVVRAAADDAAPPDRILHSDARRTVETADLVREGLALGDGALAADARLYLADLATLLAVIDEQGERGVAHLMLVGHNPGLETLAGWLARREAPELATATLCRYALPDGFGALTSSAARDLAPRARLLRTVRPGRDRPGAS